MSWRILYIESSCRLSYKNNYLLIRKEDIQMVHLSEIHTIIIESSMVTLTSYLLAELVNRKIKVIFCDLKHNPISELVPLNRHYESSGKIFEQLKWKSSSKDKIFTAIIKRKIQNQRDFLANIESSKSNILTNYLEETELMDSTNREALAAKNYFPALFGEDFTREDGSIYNDYLNYGYIILLSIFNRAVAAEGYLTQLGLKHDNIFNPFNLTCDLMEPFRFLIDAYTYKNVDETSDFDSSIKKKIVALLNEEIEINDKSEKVKHAISIYVHSVFNAIANDNENLIHFPEFKL